jgi:hypothetical protein
MAISNAFGPGGQRVVMAYTTELTLIAAEHGHQQMASYDLRLRTRAAADPLTRTEAAVMFQTRDASILQEVLQEKLRTFVQNATTKASPPITDHTHRRGLERQPDYVRDTRFYRDQHRDQRDPREQRDHREHQRDRLPLDFDSKGSKTQPRLAEGKNEPPPRKTRRTGPGHEGRGRAEGR